MVPDCETMTVVCQPAARTASSKGSLAQSTGGRPSPTLQIIAAHKQGEIGLSRFSFPLTSTMDQSDQKSTAHWMSFSCLAVTPSLHLTDRQDRQTDRQTDRAGVNQWKSFHRLNAHRDSCVKIIISIELDKFVSVPFLFPFCFETCHWTQSCFGAVFINMAASVFRVNLPGKSFSTQTLKTLARHENDSWHWTCFQFICSSLMLYVNNRQQEINESEPQPRIESITCCLLVCCCKAQARATKVQKCQTIVLAKWILLVSNLLLRTKVALDDVPYLDLNASAYRNTYFTQLLNDESDRRQWKENSQFGTSPNS